ncbi:hypothetical protein Tco_1204069 [Tanacetum coccineum]
MLVTLDIPRRLCDRPLERLYNKGNVERTRCRPIYSGCFKNEVIDIVLRRLARSANPLALLADAQPISITTIRHHILKIELKDITCTSNSFSTRHNDPDIARGNKDMQRNLDSFAYSLEIILFEDSGQLWGSGNSRQSRVVCKEWVQCFNCKGICDTMRNAGSQKREIDEQELEAHYSYMAKIQEVSHAESSSTDTPLEQVQNHDENDVFANVRRHSEQHLTIASDRKDIDIQEGLKTKTYEISVVNQKYDELAKKSLLTRSQFEGQLKEKTKVISDGI